MTDAARITVGKAYVSNEDGVWLIVEQRSPNVFVGHYFAEGREGSTRFYLFNSGDAPALPEKMQIKSDQLDAVKASPAPAKLCPQSRQILTHLREVGSLTNIEAQALYRCRSLPRRIADLKENGYQITSVMKVDATGQKYARYYYQPGVE